MVMTTLLLSALPGAAQLQHLAALQQTPLAESFSRNQSKAEKSSSPDQDAKKNPPGGRSNDRLFFAPPNFLTIENAGRIPPLPVGQEFKVVTRSAFDYIEYPWCAALASISQAENSERTLRAEGRWLG
jgi:hypothetical protein